MNAPTGHIRRQRVWLAATLFISLFGLYQFAQRPYEAGTLLASRRILAVASGWLVVCLALLVFLALTWTAAWPRLQRQAAGAFRVLARLQRWNFLLFVVLAFAYAYLLLGQFGFDFERLNVRLSLLWLVSIAGWILLKAAGRQEHDGLLLVFVLVTIAGIYRAGAHLAEVSDYPFTLNWSEASRYYYASLFFARQLYGQDLPPTVLHPSRYLLQAVPFLLPDSPIWLHRLWQALLWIGTTLLTSWMLVRRLGPAFTRLAALAWAFLFLLLGPVYYHLQVAALLVLFFYRQDRLWLTTAGVLAGSLWAGISRVNWFPVPAMLAASLYLLESPLGGRPVWRYLLPPALWGLVGAGAAFAAQALYALISGNPTEQFASSFSSDLLWYRLLPNPTYPLGVLLSAVLLCLPLFLLLYDSVQGNWRRLHWVRWTGIGAMLSALLAGGLVVSTKIGGGSNLHNLDAFFTVLLVVLVYLFFGLQAEDQPSQPGPEPIPDGHVQNRRALWRPLLLGVLLFITLRLTLAYGAPLKTLTPDETKLALERIHRAVQDAVSDGGKVLFIAERQLLTFRTLTGVELVPDYERVFLMEMAMANNTSYLQRFHQELSEQRFALIISEPLFQRYKGRQESFGEENDAWVRNVSEPVLCYYEMSRTLRSVPLQMLVPRDVPAADCKSGQSP